LKAIEAEVFDLLLCDIGLPDGSGYEVLNAIRKSSDKVKCVAVSGFFRPDGLKKSLEAGFDACLTKPVELDDLEKLLASFKA